MGETHVIWKANNARDFVASATHPIVLKLAFGHRSDNVQLLTSEREARYWVGRLFGDGVVSLTSIPPLERSARVRYRLTDLFRVARGRRIHDHLGRGPVAWLRVVPGVLTRQCL